MMLDSPVGTAGYVCEYAIGLLNREMLRPLITHCVDTREYQQGTHREGKVAGFLVDILPLLPFALAYSIVLEVEKQAVTSCLHE